MAQLTCIVVTPEQTALETEADFIVLPLSDGEIGLAPGRAPLIGRLGYGEMRLRKGEKTLRYYVDGGFVQVVNNTVSVLTGRAIAAEKIDVAVAQKQLAAAKGPTPTDELYMLQEKSILQARAQINTAKKAGK
jgi:F-type H+-transporting ATPase subunit epsilon